ncbi:MAG: carboxypeptidase-like regulatory domain-containing protein, partial [Bacteroidia bacterium]|nr:carboxypeptidase-like regulatory domain-containing protein [Bacteroidia bacterium]
MFLFKQLITFLILFFIAGQQLFSATISGTITDEKKQPLSFAGVYADGTTLGTSANIDGNYKLELKPGKYKLVFRYVGYKALEKNIEAGTENIVLDVSLELQQFQLSEVTIASDAEDPAYA